MHRSVSLTRRLAYALRQMHKEARATRVHFTTRGKTPPAWVAQVIDRVPGALGYLAARVERYRRVASPAASGTDARC